MVVATRQKDSRQRLTEDKYFNLIEHAADGIAIIQDGVFKLVNTALTRISGYDKEELLGMPFTKLLTPESQKLTLARYQARLDGKKVPPIYEIKAVTKGGKVRDIEVNAALTEYEGHIADEVIVRDITERKQVEEALREAEEERSALLEEAPVGICHTDLKGKIKYVNKRFEEESGYSREEIIGKNAFNLDWFSKGTLRYFMRRMAARLGGKPHKYWETQFKRKDGTWIWVTTEGKVLKRLGVPVGFQIVARNITERKEAEEALQESNKRFRDIVENALEWIWEVDTSGKYTYASPVVEKILGYKPEEVLEKHFYDLFHPDDRQELKEAALAAFAQKQPFRQFVNRNIRKNGETVWLSTSGVPILDEEGNLLGYRGADVDITERKQAEDELKLRAQILDGATDSIFVHGADDNFIYANEAACRTHGYSREEFMKMKIPQIVDPERARPLDLDRQELLKKGHIVVESAHLRKDGSVVPVEVHARTIESGGRRLFITVARNITERKQAEEALKLQTAYFQQLFDNSPEAIVLLNENNRIVNTNKGFETLFGYTMEEVKGRTISEVIVPENHIEEAHALGQAFLNNEVSRKETVRKRKDGSRVDVSLLAYPIWSGTKIVGAYVIYTDITKRKQAEEKLRQAKEEFQALAEESPLGVSVLRKDGRYQYLNPKFVEMFGYTLEDIPTGREWFAKAYPDPEYRSQVIVNWVTDAKSSKRGEVGAQTYTVTCKDGSAKIVHFRPVALETGDYFVIYEDITERKQAEEVLRESEEKYRTIFENVSEVIIRLDRYGKIVDINGRAEECFGYKPEEVIGKNFAKTGVLSLKDLPKMVKLFGEIIRGKRAPFILELEAKRKDGSPVLIEVNSKLVKKNGKSEGFVTIVRDITERKQAEEALRESEERYRAVIEGAHDMIQSVTPDGRIIFVNQAWLDTLGYTDAELPGLNLFQIIHPDSQPHCQELFTKVLSGEPVHEVQASFLTKEGRRILVEGNATPRYIGNKVVATQGIFRNVTERKQMEEQLQEKNEQLDSQNEELRAINEELQTAEEQLQEKNEQLDSQNEELRAINEELRVTEEELQQSQEKLERMFESVTDGIIVADLGGTIIKVNERAVQMHGFTSEGELLGKTAFELVAPSDHEKIAKNMRKALKEGSIRSQEYTLLKSDGSEFPGELGTSMLKDGWGNIVGHITIARDITKRKQMEELFRTVTNSSPVGIYIIQDRKFQVVNPQFQKLTGYTEDELLGMDSLALVVDEDRDVVREKAVNMLKGKRSAPYQFRVVNKAGETRWGMETVTSIQYRGRKAILGNYMDITERRQAEEREDQLQQELNLASRLASVGQLAAGVAHEINNPLTGVIGFSHLMLGRDIPDDIKQDLQVINSEAQRVAKIVENLLTFAHQRKPGRESVDINDIIARVLELRAYEMKVNNIEVETQFAPDLPYTMADAGQLQQVFLNIVLNAEHFMIKAHNKGKLLVKTERADGNIRVSFTDDGTGISKENLDKIFNPFFTTKEVGSGTGLGLSICHGIITRHRGRIYAQSELGKGATFVVELPIVDEPTQSGQAEVIEEKPKKPRGAKILVVDDEPAILNFLGRLLTEWGHSVETMNNADTALERLKSERYSLILLDIKLPGMSGIELYQRIEEIAPALTRRIMFVTGAIMENATRGFLEKTGVPHITKPLNIELLKKTINRALNQTQVVAKTPG